MINTFTFQGFTGKCPIFQSCKEVVSFKGQFYNLVFQAYIVFYLFHSGILLDLRELAYTRFRNLVVKSDLLDGFVGLLSYIPITSDCSRTPSFP